MALAAAGRDTGRTPLRQGFVGCVETELRDRFNIHVRCLQYNLRFAMQSPTMARLGPILRSNRGRTVPSLPVPGGRSSKRTLGKTRASVIVTSYVSQKRMPCLVLDSSKDGFRLRGTFHLRRGQVVEVILEDEPLNSVRCSVVWIGKAGTKQEGEVGLQTV